MHRQDRIRRHYERRIDPKRESFDVLDWASAHSQHKRFEVLLEHVLLSGRTLLDVGCGLGDLCLFLQQRKVDVAYTGIDLLEPMVAEARRRCRQGTFEVANLFDPDAELSGQWDVSFASGVFNLNLGNNHEFVALAIPRMMQVTRQRVVFNMLHERQKFEPHRYFYSHPDRIRRMLAPTGWRLRIIEGYLPNDFTVICTPPDMPAQADNAQEQARLS
jgi:cyclopropane fatty-acyl-phospholipid synthase-like methyltransferase